MPVKPGLLLLGAAGGIVAYSGLKGKGIGAAFRSVIAGQSPAKATDANPITGTSANPAYGFSNNYANIGAGSATGEQIAADALAYQGNPYCLGGSYYASTMGCPIGTFDCSSFANLVIGRDLGLSIPFYPNGSYKGTSHGPTTFVWLVWPGCVNVRRQDVQAGDLIVWQTHMGIAISNSQMISAQTPGSGTKVSAIDGFMLTEVPTYRRLRQSLQVGSGSPRKR